MERIILRPDINGRNTRNGLSSHGEDPAQAWGSLNLGPAPAAHWPDGPPNPLKILLFITGLSSGLIGGKLFLFDNHKLMI
jgi:hypothetical protein